MTKFDVTTFGTCNFSNQKAYDLTLHTVLQTENPTANKYAGNYRPILIF